MPLGLTLFFIYELLCNVLQGFKQSPLPYPFKTLRNEMVYHESNTYHKQLACPLAQGDHSSLAECQLR